MLIAESAVSTQKVAHKRGGCTRARDAAQMARWHLRRCAPQTRATLRRPRSHPPRAFPAQGFDGLLLDAAAYLGPHPPHGCARAAGTRRVRRARLAAPRPSKTRSPACEARGGSGRRAPRVRAQGSARTLSFLRCAALPWASPQLSRTQYSRPRAHADDGKTQKAVWPCLARPADARERSAPRGATLPGSPRAAPIAARWAWGAVWHARTHLGGILGCLLDTPRWLWSHVEKFVWCETQT